MKMMVTSFILDEDPDDGNLLHPDEDPDLFIQMNRSQAHTAALSSPNPAAGHH